MAKVLNLAKNIVELAPWIRTLSGPKGTVIYDFKSKRTLVVSPLIWNEVVNSLPNSPETLFDKLCSIFATASLDNIARFLDTLVSKAILVRKSDLYDLSESSEDYTFTDDIPGFPKFVSIEITTRCNYRCLHCYLGDAKNNPVDLPRKTIERLSSELKKLKVENVQITGGEPLLRADSVEILESMSSSFLIELTTNGSFISDDTVDRLSCVNSIQISVYGFSQHSYEEFTGTSDKNGLSRLINNILNVKRKGISLTLAYVVTPNNQNEIEDFVAFCIEQGIEYKLGFSMPIGACCENMSLLAMDLERKREIIRQYRDIPVDPTLKKYCCNPNKIAVLADGRVLACSMLRDKCEYVYGNVHQESIAKIWKMGVPKFANAVELDRLSPCSNCELRYICGGVCPALNRDEIIGAGIESCKMYNGQDLLIFKKVR